MRLCALVRLGRSCAAAPGSAWQARAQERVDIDNRDDISAFLCFQTGKVETQVRTLQRSKTLTSPRRDARGDGAEQNTRVASGLRLWTNNARRSSAAQNTAICRDCAVWARLELD